MLFYRRAGVVALLAIVAVLTGGTAAWAQPTVAGLEVVVRVDNPIAPVVVLTNGGASPCLVASTAVGTVSFSRVEQDGTAIEPTLYDAAFSDDLDVLLAGDGELELI